MNAQATAPSRLTTPTAVAFVATTVATTFAVLIAPGSGALESLPVRVAYDAATVMALVFWLALAALRPELGPASRLWPALAAILLAFAASSATSRVPRLSVEMLGYAFLLIELYLLLVALMRRPMIRLHLQRLALVLCVVACTLYVIQVGQAWVDWWKAVGGLAIPPLRPGYLGLRFGSPNPVATLVLLLGSFGLATATFRGTLGRITGLVLIALVAYATLISGSRGAWLGAAVGVVAVVIASILTRPELRDRARTLPGSRLGLAALLVGVPLVVGASVLAGLSGRLTLDDGGYRAAFSTASLEMFRSSPWTGVGPGVWGTLRSASTPEGSLDFLIPHAHNVYLQVLSEFGLLGVLVALYIALILGRLLGSAIRSDDPTRSRVGLAALFAVVLLAVQQLADVLMNVPALLVAMVLPVAWLDATRPPVTQESRERIRRRLWPRLIPLGLATLTCITAVGLARIESVTDIADRGVSAANDQNWSGAVSSFREAVMADPRNNIYQFQLGVSAANAGDLRLAEEALQTSASMDDYAIAWVNLAAVRLTLGEVTEARYALARAERLGTQRTPVALAAGWLHFRLGEESAAIDDYAAAIILSPSLADDPFWTSERSSPATQEELIEAIDRRAAPVDRLRIYLVMGRYDLAKIELANVGSSDPGVYANLMGAWEGDAAAWGSLQATAASRPLDPVPAWWCRFIAAHRNDDKSVSRYGMWLWGVGGPDNSLPLDGRVTIASVEPQLRYTLDRYGSIYRRPPLDAELVRLLPQIAWTPTSTALQLPAPDYRRPQRPAIGTGRRSSFLTDLIR